MSARVALATCAAFPQLADDEPLLLDQLRARGSCAEPVVWDDPTVDWNAYELVVVRTTWDYSWRREAFLAWVESLARVLNAADVIRWNTDKRYLAELPHVVPTTCLARRRLGSPGGRIRGQAGRGLGFARRGPLPSRPATADAAHTRAGCWPRAGRSWSSPTSARSRTAARPR